MIQQRGQSQRVSPPALKEAPHNLTSAGSISSGMRAIASERKNAYSAYPPSVIIPLMFSFLQVTKSPFLHWSQTPQWPD